jgi:hypothetical protein
MNVILNLRETMRIEKGIHRTNGEIVMMIKIVRVGMCIIEMTTDQENEKEMIANTVRKIKGKRVYKTKDGEVLNQGVALLREIIGRIRSEYKQNTILIKNLKIRSTIERKINKINLNISILHSKKLERTNILFQSRINNYNKNQMFIKKINIMGTIQIRKRNL